MTNPRYVERDGQQILVRQPYLQSDTFLSGWLLETTQAAQQAILDNALNEPCGGTLSYRAISRWVLFSFANIQKVHSLNPADAGKGYAVEQDVCIWVPAAVYVNGRLDRVVFYLAYIVVTDPVAVTIGREVYGFPKMLGVATMPEKPEDRGPFTAETFVLPVYTPDTKVESRQFLKVTRGADGSGVARAAITSVEELVVELVRVVKGDLDPVHDVELLAKLATDGLAARVPCVFLRQLRDPGNADAASYQAIIEANATITGLGGVGFWPDTFTFDFTAYDSLRIAETLGMMPSQTVAFGFWVKFSFSMDLGTEVWRAATPGIPPRQKVAVLGGGVGGMIAAFALTGTPELRARYDVTVYQRGHRLGGKGASGRNAAEHDRIEEHGLHIWMGFYDNAFRAMRDAYAELGRPAGAPLATLRDAFKEQSYAVLTNKLSGAGLPDDGWFDWTFDFPTNGFEPGTPHVLPTLWNSVVRAIEWVGEQWSARPVGLAEHAVEDRHAGFLGAIEGVIEGAIARGEQVLADLFSFGTRAPIPPERLGPLGPILTVLRSLGEDLTTHPRGTHAWLAKAIRGFMGLVWDLLGPSVVTDRTAYELWVSVNLPGSFVVGVLEDDLLVKGFESVNDVDFAAWLARSGANEVTTSSGPVKGIYDLVFGFVGGAARRGALAAGLALHGALRMILTYRGSLFWEMQAGMGDTVFGPLYQVLERRGVTFAFFEQVAALHPSADGKSIVTIDMVRQADVKNGGAYEPLVSVKGLPCWPSLPLYDQLDRGDDIAASGVDFENAYTKPWGGEAPYTLVRGVDFDQVVLAIAVGALPGITSELSQRSPAWKRMLDGARTVQTLATQLWLKPDLAGLGWQKPPGIAENPVLSSYVDPFNTWADMSHLLQRESFTGPDAPKNVAYFCGPLQQEDPLPPLSDHGYPARALAAVKAQAAAYFDANIGRLWPSVATRPDHTGFDTTQVASQYWRANVDPCEGYVLSVPGTIEARLAPDATGFDNLFIAGDWVATSINAGCVEAATLAGLGAAQALSGVDMNIIGARIPLGK